MLVAARAFDAESDDAVFLLADRQRDRDVQIPVEAVALVEAADLEKDLAPCGRAVALHGVGLAVGHLVEVLEVARAKAPRTDQANARIGERAVEWGEEIAGQLDRAVQLEDEPPARHPEEPVPRRALAEVAVREESLNPIIRRGELCQAVLRLGAGTRVQDEHLAVARQPPQHACET